MKKRIQEDIPAQRKELLQELLEDALQTVIKQFFETSLTKKHPLSEDAQLDIAIGALVTLFTKKLAYFSAQDTHLNREDYLQQLFVAISQLFNNCRAEYIEVLKDKEEKNLSSH